MERIRNQTPEVFFSMEKGIAGWVYCWQCEWDLDPHLAGDLRSFTL